MADNGAESDGNGNLWTFDLGVNIEDISTVSPLLDIEGLVQNSTQDCDWAQGGIARFRNENFTELGIQNMDSATLRNLHSSQLIGVDILCDAVHVENDFNDALVEEEFPGTSRLHIPSALPPVSDWPGDNNFLVSFGHQEKTTKGLTWAFSEGKNKLYVGKDVPCPINFSADKIINDVFIRATVLYSSPGHTSEVVERCPTHLKKDTALGIFEAEHFVRCESNMSKYEVDPLTKQRSVKVPFENPPAGQKFSTYIFKFLCFGSCVGGPNRRPLMIIFTLEESGGRTIGRRKLELKVCACPERDRKTEEESLRKINPLPSKSSKRKKPESEGIMNLASAFGLEKKRKATMRKEKGYFTITTRDEGCHQFLREMKEMYSLSMAVNNLHPDARKTLMNLARDQRAIGQEE